MSSSNAYLLLTEAILTLLVLLEPPGPRDSDGNLKSFSAGFEQHMGFACAFFLLGLMLMKRAGKDLPQWVRVGCMWVSAVGGTGLILYNDINTPEHNYFAATALVGPLVLSSFLWGYQLTWGVGVVLGWVAAIFAFLAANVTALKLNNMGLMGWMEITILLALGVDWGPLLWDI